MSDWHVHDPRENWAPYDPETDTNGGWYNYPSIMYEIRADAEADAGTLFERPRVAWAADAKFVDDFFHRMEKQFAEGERGRAHSNELIVRHMLDCMRRDHKPWDGPPIPWHKTGVTQ